MSILTNKQFNTKLSSLIRSAKTQRDNVQQLVLSGLEQYQAHGNTGQLTKLIQACVGVRSLPTTVIKEFIKAHANVAFQKNKNGDYVFKKIGKDVEVTTPECTWYDWEGNKEAKPAPDMNIIVQAKTLASKIEKAIKDHKVKGVDDAHAGELLSSLRSWLQANDKSNVVSISAQQLVQAPKA